MEEPWPTRHSTMQTKKTGRTRIEGKLRLFFSMTVPDGQGSWRLLTCLGTASFTAKTVRRRDDSASVDSGGVPWEGRLRRTPPPVRSERP